MFRAAKGKLAAALALLLLAACEAKAPESNNKTHEKPHEKTHERAAAEPSEAEQAPAKAAKPAASEPRSPALADTMREHFTHATALEQAVIDGDLEFVAQSARALTSDVQKTQMPPAWLPHVERLQAAAATALVAKDLDAAATAAGRVIETCGACHTATGGGPKFAEASPVPVGEDTHARMARHLWAAQRMREGVIGPSDERWRLGAGAVSVAPPEPCPIEDAEILPAEVLQLRERIYEIGAKAAKTEGLEARARVYGEYLTTCAGCHAGGC